MAKFICYREDTRRLYGRLSFPRECFLRVVKVARVTYKLFVGSWRQSISEFKRFPEDGVPKLPHPCDCLLQIYQSL